MTGFSLNLGEINDVANRNLETAEFRENLIEMAVVAATGYVGTAAVGASLATSASAAAGSSFMQTLTDFGDPFGLSSSARRGVEIAGELGDMLDDGVPLSDGDLERIQELYTELEDLGVGVRTVSGRNAMGEFGSGGTHFDHSDGLDIIADVIEERTGVRPSNSNNNIHGSTSYNGEYDKEADPADHPGNDVGTCSGLQTSGARPANIGVKLPRLTATIDGV